jgi:hypothetical protein
VSEHVPRSSKEQVLLVDRFVASFESLSDLLVTHESLDPVAWRLGGECDHRGFKHWRPMKVETDRSLIEKIYAKLAARFPPLFELLVLSYRWAQVDLRLYELLANPPGPDLGGFLQQMSRDLAVWTCLKTAGYMQFGRGPGGDYDPVCFDIRSRNKRGDCRIVKIDHEQILCNDLVKVRSELAPSFEQLMLRTIDQTDQL